MVRIKICGITKLEDAKLAADLGAYAIGLNFYTQSPRSITPAAAADLVDRLPPLLSVIGVFVNWDAKPVVSLSRALHLSAAQLHGDETPRVADAVAKQIQVIKALRVGQGTPPPPFAKYRSAAGFLIDAAQSGQYGGTGALANWHLARTIAQTHRVILAGGLSPENVGEAIRVVRPYAVDVASGVESRPGRKDPAKLRAFFDEVARANRDHFS
ncbi:MAG TPA: phosphoribosylanthranilate isomerase [Candidatus Eisenbacteria bacterium]|nr:phosphoribosylanthranilate isomerase [Candidatus Eisenbacteria bacterium]